MTIICMVQMSKIFWQQTIEGQIVEFDNTPFVVSEICKLDCQFGKHCFKPLALVVFISRRLAAKHTWWVAQIR